MKKRIFSLLSMAVLTLTLAAPTMASVLTLNYAGSFGPTSTLNGSPFGVDTPFTLQATFDPSADLLPVSGVGVFSITSFSIYLQGATYRALASPLLNVAFEAPPTILFYAVGFVDSVAPTSGFVTYFTTATPYASADAPASTQFSNFVGNFIFVPYTIMLNNGDGDLVINDFGATGNYSANFTESAVPEPSTYLLLCLSLGAVGIARRRLRVKN